MLLIADKEPSTRHHRNLDDPGEAQVFVDNGAYGQDARRQAAVGHTFAGKHKLRVKDRLSVARAGCHGFGCQSVGAELTLGRHRSGKSGLRGDECPTAQVARRTRSRRHCRRCGASGLLVESAASVDGRPYLDAAGKEDLTSDLRNERSGGRTHRARAVCIFGGVVLLALPGEKKSVRMTRRRRAGAVTRWVQSATELVLLCGGF